MQESSSTALSPPYREESANPLRVPSLFVRLPDLLSNFVIDRRAQRIYWDFESFLTENGIALDLLDGTRKMSDAVVFALLGQSYARTG